MILFPNLSIVNLLDSDEQIYNNFDIFVLSGSFEDRCSRGIDILSTLGSRIQNSIIFNFKDVDPEKRKNTNLMKVIEQISSISQKYYIYNSESISSPSSGVKKFIKYITENEIDFTNKKILIDISVIPKPYYFLLIKVFKDLYDVNELFIIYTEPKGYKKMSDGKYILTEGLDIVKSIPGYSGSNIMNKNALIMLLGFEGNRSLEVYLAVEPDITYAINGFPSHNPIWHKISFESNIRFLKESNSFQRLAFSPTIDPFATYDKIKELVSEIKTKSPEFNIVICPLGTKIQSLGVLLFAVKNRDVKVIYPFPSIYRIDYSYEYGDTWIMHIDMQLLG